MVTSSSKDVRDASTPDDDPTPEAEPRSIDFGLVIGIDHYVTAPRLQGAVTDAMQFHDWLCEPGGGGLAPGRAKLITSQDEAPGPLQEHVDRALCDIVTEAKDAGGARRLYFHFSGHGWASAEKEDVALLLAKWSRSLADFALSSSEYRERIWRTRVFEEIVVLLDCCRSIAERAIGVPPTIDCRPHREPSAALAFIGHATEHGHRASETRRGTLWQGMFTRCLLETLRSAPDGISAADLKKQLDYAIGVQGQRPQVTNGLRPESRFGGNRGGTGGGGNRGGGQSAAPRLVITLREVATWVRLSDGDHQVVATYRAAPGIWEPQVAPGLYKLEDSVGRKCLIDHTAAVTRVKFPADPQEPTSSLHTAAVTRVKS